MVPKTLTIIAVCGLLYYILGEDVLWFDDHAALSMWIVVAATVIAIMFIISMIFDEYEGWFLNLIIIGLCSVLFSLVRVEKVNYALCLTKPACAESKQQTTEKTLSEKKKFCQSFVSYLNTLSDEEKVTALRLTRTLCNY